MSSRYSPEDLYTFLKIKMVIKINLLINLNLFFYRLKHEKTVVKKKMQIFKKM